MTASPERRRQHARNVKRQDARAAELQVELEAWFATAFPLLLQRALIDLDGEALKSAAFPGLSARLKAIVDRYGLDVAARASAQNGVNIRDRDVARVLSWRGWREMIARRLADNASRRVLEAARTEIEDNPASRGLGERIRNRAGEDVRRGRDALIASRNIVATAEGIGQEHAYDEQGVEVVMWLAFSSPQWPRRHDLLDGVMQLRGEAWNMPKSRHTLSRPHDPQGHVSEVINCRCDLAPVIPGSRDWDRFVAQHGDPGSRPRVSR